MRAPGVSSTIEPLDAVITAHIERALEATAGRVDGPHGAARILRINPHTLRARMRKLRIDWRRFRVSPTADAVIAPRTVASRVLSRRTAS